MPPKTSARARALLLALVLAVGAPLQGAWAQVRLPALGESAGEEFSVGTERSLGEQIMREIRRDPDYLDDPLLLDYVQRIWRPLLEAARQRGDITADTAQLLAWEVFLVRDRSVNAFALPGGFVGVHLGLIAATGSGDELAAVLAHELTHVTQRHIARGIVNTQRTTLLSLAGLILGMIAASKAGNADATQAVIVGAQAAAAQSQLNYSRDMEREADRVGFGVLTDAGYAPSGMAAMFEKLEQANRLNDSNAFPYLRSHPLTVERISEARSRLALSGSAPVGDTLTHALMGARARVLAEPGVHALRRQQERIAGEGNVSALPLNERLAALYAGALAASLLGDGTAAMAATARALDLLPATAPPSARRELELLQAQVLVQRGDAAAALKRLEPHAGPPPSRPVLLLRGQAALAQWQAQAAPSADASATQALRGSNEALQSWVAIHRLDPLAWGLLAQTEEALGQRLRALRAQAESRAALGDIGGAIDRLRAAQALVRSGAANDFIESSIIDSRLRQLEAQRRQLAAEMRGGKPP